MTTESQPSPQLCPKCRDVALTIPSGRATRVLRCPSCRGSWLPTDEARVEAVRDLMEADDSMLPGQVSDQRTGLCPGGHGILIRAKVDLEEPFYLERCADCGGIWFDKGEWNKLARSHLLSNLNDLWNPAVRWRVYKERAETSYREKLKGEVGASTFELLNTVAEQLRGRPEQVKLAALAYLREQLDS